MSRYSIGYISYVGFSSEKYYLNIIKRFALDCSKLSEEEDWQNIMFPSEKSSISRVINYLALGFSYSKYLNVCCCELQNVHFPYTDDVLRLESLHDSRPVLGTVSSSGVELFQVFMGHGCGRMGQTSRCFIVCSSPHSHVVCPS